MPWLSNRNSNEVEVDGEGSPPAHVPGLLVILGGTVLALDPEGDIVDGVTLVHPEDGATHALLEDALHVEEAIRDPHADVRRAAVAILDLQEDALQGGVVTRDLLAGAPLGGRGKETENENRDGTIGDQGLVPGLPIGEGSPEVKHGGPGAWIGKKTNMYMLLAVEADQVHLGKG